MGVRSFATTLYPLNLDFNIRRHMFKLIAPDEFHRSAACFIYGLGHMRGVIANRIPLIKELKLERW